MSVHKNVEIFILFLLIFHTFSICDGSLQDSDPAGLTDEEVKIILSELSLSDLNALSQLIDSQNEMDYNCAEDRFLDSNSKAADSYALNSNKDYIFQVFDKPETEIIPPGDENLAYEDIKQFNNKIFYSSLQNKLFNFGEQTPRSKREEHELNLDEDYIKQLHDSFPRDTEESNQDDDDIKTEHVRVKRN